MTEPTPNADEALAAKWLRQIGGVSTLVGGVIGLVAGILASIALELG